MLVELKDGVTLNGHLVNCDTWMNLTLKEVVQTSAEGDQFFRMPEVYVRGNNVKIERLYLTYAWTDKWFRSNISGYLTISSSLQGNNNKTSPPREAAEVVSAEETMEDGAIVDVEEEVDAAGDVVEVDRNEDDACSDQGFPASAESGKKKADDAHKDIPAISSASGELGSLTKPLMS